MTLRDDHAALVAEYVNRGGGIAAPESAAATEVLIYLRQNGFGVRVVPGPMGLGLRFVYKERPVSPRRLVALANGHRSARGLPLFHINGGLLR